MRIKILIPLVYWNGFNLAVLEENAVYDIPDSLALEICSSSCGREYEVIK
jgi:hypothetical protein